jgi:hypothetical protein
MSRSRPRSTHICLDLESAGELFACRRCLDWEVSAPARPAVSVSIGVAVQTVPGSVLVSISAAMAWPTKANSRRRGIGAWSRRGRSPGERSVSCSDQCLQSAGRRIAKQCRFRAAIKDGRSPSAVATIAIDRTDKPRPYTTEVASRQSDRHPLLDRFPVVRARIAVQ